MYIYIYCFFIYLFVLFIYIYVNIYSYLLYTRIYINIRIDQAYLEIYVPSLDAKPATLNKPHHPAATRPLALTRFPWEMWCSRHRWAAMVACPFGSLVHWTRLVFSYKCKNAQPNKKDYVFYGVRSGISIAA